MAGRASCVKDSGKAHQAPSCRGRHFARTPFPPAKNAKTKIIAAHLKVKTLQALKQQRRLIQNYVYTILTVVETSLNQMTAS